MRAILLLAGCLLAFAVLHASFATDLLKSQLTSTSDNFAVRVSAQARQPLIEFWSLDQPTDIFQIRLYSIFEAIVSNDTSLVNSNITVGTSGSTSEGGADVVGLINGTNVTTGDGVQNQLFYQEVIGSRIPLGLLQWDVSQPQEFVPATSQPPGTASSTTRALTLPPIISTVSGQNQGNNNNVNVVVSSNFTVQQSALFNISATCKHWVLLCVLSLCRLTNLRAAYIAGNNAPFELFQLRIRMTKGMTSAKMDVLVRNYQ
jgi:hypothetical protein